MSAKLTTNVDQRLLRTTKFPPEFNTKVDMRKVNIHIIKKWVSDELARLLNGEDDVVTELVFNIIEENNFPNIKELQVQLSGFLDKDAAKFCLELWKLCLSAQSNPQGIPKELLEAKKTELIQERIEEERMREEATKRQQAERERDRELDRMRDRERNERRGRGGGRFDRRPPRRDSRSPPRRYRRDDDDYSRPTRGADTWAPSHRDDRASRRRPSPSYGRPRSPPPPRRRRRSSTSPSSRSRSPRRRRNTSSDRSFSPARRRRLDRKDRSRSPDHRDSPPSKRSRRRSPSPSRSQRDEAADSRPSNGSSAASPPEKTKGADLMGKANRSNDGRLSQQPDEYTFLGAAQRERRASENEEKLRAAQLRAAELRAELLRRRSEGFWDPAGGAASKKR